MEPWSLSLGTPRRSTVRCPQLRHSPGAGPFQRVTVAGVRITVAPGIDIDARPGATVREIVDAGAVEGFALPERPWCGDVRLDPDHPVGVWPVLEGASLAAERSGPCAPPRGVILRAIAGPDAGAWALLGDADASIGRDPGSTLTIDDPSLSRRHATVRAGARFVAADNASLNGTWRWRSGRRRRVVRRTECEPGDILELGHTLVAIEDADAASAALVEAEERASLRETLGHRIAPLAGSLGMGAMMAAMTGRWWILLVGLAYPAIVVVPAVVGASRRPRGAPDVEATPSQLPCSRSFWSAITGTIAVVGEAGAARGFARAIVLAQGRRPCGDSWTEPWMSWLPPAGSADADVVIAGEAAPSWAESVVRVGGERTTVTVGGRTLAAPVVRVSEDSAEAWVRAIAGARGSFALPRVTRLADLAGEGDATAPGAARGRRSVSAPVGVGVGGPLFLDLDSHGPHLLVAGTTGSGKSAFLETLVLALADRLGPDDLAVALIDFKGGAGLRSCMDLPHVAGTLTDLDSHLARRALAALSDELLSRKRHLTEAGHTSFQAWESAGGAPARLLVVIDEYQELVALYRAFLPDLARLAAQGRSLGLHLVLATQRPAGAVTPEVRANIGSTIALRVASEAESRDLVGSRDAADIPRELPGRAILAFGGERVPFQAALPSATPSCPVTRWGDALRDADATGLATQVRRRWPDASVPQLWLPPLPKHLGAADRPTLDARHVWLGRGDVPSERTQPEAVWDPATGPLVVVGPSGSGRTTLLSTIAAQASGTGWKPIWLPSDAREAARTLALARQADDALLVVDDGARAFISLGEVDRGRAQEDLLTLLTCGRPVALALPLAGPARLASHAAIRVVLSGGDPADEALWSVPRDLQGLSRSPGRGVIGEGGRWIETQIAVLEPVDGPEGRPLVASLPRELSADVLPRASSDGRFPVGVGGDDAAPVYIEPSRPLLIVGESARERAATVAALQGLARRFGAEVSLRELENPLAVPRREIDGATVVAVAPTPRLVADIAGADTSGLVDPRPLAGRVVMVVDGAARAVQLAAA